MSYASEPARPHDLPQALELLRRADLPETGVVEEFGHYLVVRDAGRVMGVCGLEIHGSAGLLRSLVVDPNYRGEGVGSLLVEATLELARKMDLAEVYLLTTTAREYFARRGFVDCPREQAPPAIRESWEFKVGCSSTSALMKRRVAPGP